MTKSEWQDFRNQFPDVDIRFVDLQHRVHDRYIVVDFGDKQEKLYLSGPSSKDAGAKIGMMIRVSDIEPMRIIIEQLMKHPVFIIH